MSSAAHAVCAVGEELQPAVGLRYYLMTGVASRTLRTLLLPVGVEGAFCEEVEVEMGWRYQILII